MRVDDPMSLPEWRAISLECKLTRQLCGGGLTSIGKANYANGMGEYYAAFFSLSVGIERLAKLIICFDKQQRTGEFPDRKFLSELGHDFGVLITEVTKLVMERKISTLYPKYDDEISAKIVKHLTAFSAAGIGRYANFLTMSAGKNPSTFEPISEWWKIVGEPVLEKHFRSTSAAKKASEDAKMMEDVLGDVFFVLHTSEDGSPLRTISSAAMRTTENIVMQKYGRFYTFTVIRWLASIFRELTILRGYEDGGEFWFGHYEHFQTFTVPNEFGLTRKIWPLT